MSEFLKSDFLKKLKESVDSGKPNIEVNQHLDDILDKSLTIQKMNDEEKKDLLEISKIKQKERSDYINDVDSFLNNSILNNEAVKEVNAYIDTVNEFIGIDTGVSDIKKENKKIEQKIINQNKIEINNLNIIQFNEEITKYREKIRKNIELIKFLEEENKTLSIND